MYTLVWRWVHGGTQQFWMSRVIVILSMRGLFVVLGPCFPRVIADLLSIPFLFLSVY